mmetsp:Transcript_11227/g.14152  ORF Transcript_11227/g.14152 Transcript_11227/m.14152 type:complete len:215 (-) Transcript_11227:180-824(-)|eukprot:CAMPEP_0203647464 /NCGR_PEP_ID=MMETSP0088-20131115/15834_1 /ASSEMBLY_ACC=CAM_ASM_001087 /TAXON_ID=426623 /ORGANISM="Chaetoceros affinis, Strain CCMP159" /LENGTH=214 /DNA_ID=CAMNT_0050505103 /DNA_START=198 /DNA_END=842 /DNA_ORIENTATION=-
MKFSTAIVLATAASASAFAPSSQSTSTGFKSSTELSMAQTSRLQFLKTITAGAAAATLSITSLPQNANAAKYGSFGAGSPEVLDPATAIIDDEILASDAVQNAFSKVKSYQQTVEQIKATLESNKQADVGPVIRKDLDFVALRTDLNTLNTAFDEDTQRGTDRLVRLILQDITELETANKQKEGVSRSEKRLSIMMGKLDKLEKAFGDYLAFAA